MTLQVYEDEIIRENKRHINNKRRKFVKVKCCMCGLEYEVVHKTKTSKCWDCIQIHQRFTAGIGRKQEYDLGGI